MGIRFYEIVYQPKFKQDVFMSQTILSLCFV